MLLLILGISLVLLIGGRWLDEHYDDDSGCYWITSFLGGVFTILSVIALCVLLLFFSGRKIIDDKINLCETQNQEINESIVATVESYKKYEKETFEELKVKDVTVIVNAYPELKSDTLVQEQIKIYTKNKKEILKLKEEKLAYKVCAWWLYFGG